MWTEDGGIFNRRAMARKPSLAALRLVISAKRQLIVAGAIKLNAKDFGAGQPGVLALLEAAALDLGHTHALLDFLRPQAMQSLPRNATQSYEEPISSSSGNGRDLAEFGVGKSTDARGCYLMLCFMLSDIEADASFLRQPGL